VRLETKPKIWLKILIIIDKVLSMLDLKNKRDKIIIVPRKLIFSNPVTVVVHGGYV